MSSSNSLPFVGERRVSPCGSGGRLQTGSRTFVARFFPPTGRLRSIYRSKARKILYKICANRGGMLSSFCKFQLAIQSKKITPRGSSNMSCEGDSLSSKCTGRCFLYKEKLIHHHSHTESWKSELQQFLLQYSSWYQCLCLQSM